MKHVVHVEVPSKEFPRDARIEVEARWRDRYTIRLQFQHRVWKLKWWRTYFETSNLNHPISGDLQVWAKERTEDLLERARLALL